MTAIHAVKLGTGSQCADAQVEVAKPLFLDKSSFHRRTRRVPRESAKKFKNYLKEQVCVGRQGVFSRVLLRFVVLAQCRIYQLIGPVALDCLTPQSGCAVGRVT